MQENGQFRKKQGFTITPNSVLNGASLSLAAIGLYTKIQYYLTIPNFILYKKILMRKCVEGTKAFESRWRELKEAGYLKVYRIRSDSNNHFTYEYELLDTADRSTPAVVNVPANKKGASETVSYIPPLGSGTDGSISEFDLLQDSGINNNTIANKTKTNNHLSINSEERKEEIEQQEMCRLLLKENIDYQSILDMDYLHIDKEMLDGWIAMMVNTISSLADSFIINDHKIFKSVLASEFKKAERHHLLHAIQKYRGVKEKIKNPEAYMRACLWSAIHTHGVDMDHEMIKLGVYDHGKSE